MVNMGGGSTISDFRSMKTVSCKTIGELCNLISANFHQKLFSAHFKKKTTVTKTILSVFLFSRKLFFHYVFRKIALQNTV